MRNASITLSILCALVAGCASETPAESEELAEATPTGKEDSFRDELAYGSFVNAAGAPRVMEFESLVLAVVEDRDLPAAHYEGRYALTEQTESGPRISEGFFNAYQYAGENWIRFLDTAADDYITNHAKYSWSFEGGVLTLRGHNAADSFSMSESSTTYSCDDYGNSPFGVDVSDALRTTPGELLLEITPTNVDDASGYFDAMGVVAGLLGVGTIEEFVESADDSTVYIYELNYGQVAYDWIKFYSGDTEVGFIFDGGTDSLAAEVSDGGIMGCRSNTDCDWSLSSPVSESTAGLSGDPLATLYTTVTGPADFTDLIEDQLRKAIRVLYEVDTSGDTLDELLDFVDEGTVEVYTIDADDAYDWLSFYGGGNEVGIMFEEGTTNVVAAVSDTDIAACTVR